MKKVFSIILSMVMFLSIMYGIEVNASTYPNYQAYCYVCQKSVSCYYDKIYRVPPPLCEEDVCVTLSCGHQRIIYSVGHAYHATVSDTSITYYCYRCLYTYTELLSEHKCSDIADMMDTKPTCTAPGRTGGKNCVYCGSIVEEPTIIPPLGHNLVSNKDGKEATCTESGYTDSYKCKRYDSLYGYCDYVVEREVIPALGHDMGSHDAFPTCEEEGRKGGNYCGNPGCDVVIEEPTIIPPTGHKEVTTKGVKPTCTGIGISDGKHCSVCFKVLVPQEKISETGHTIVEDPMVYPTCTETGLTKGKHCSGCGEIFLEQKVLKIKDTAHTPKTTGKKSATYFTKGYSGDKVCKDCDEVISKGKSTPVLKLKTPTAKYTTGKKTIKVKYTKVKDATGFQVRYKLGKKTITKNYTTKKSVTKTIRNLKKGTYKVQIRSFIKQGSKKAYSNWTKAVKVKIK